jgi:multidrug resistance efflux pump
MLIFASSNEDEKMNIDPEAAEKALIEAKGSVGNAARALDVPSAELRKFVTDNPKLRAQALEATERDLDKAEQIILDGMDSQDKMKRLEAAALVLKGRFRA